MHIMEFLRSSWGIYALSWFLAGMFMWAGARFTGLLHAGFFRAEIAAVGVTLVTWTIAGMLADSLGWLGFVTALCITVWVIKEIFETTWHEAFMVWVFNAAAQFGLVFIGWNTGVLQRSLIHTFPR